MSVVPEVLLGIATRNRAELLTKSLRSALVQTMPKMQVVVVDDGSIDATPSLHAQFPSVLWHRRESSLGYMSARNEMMARSGLDYFVSLDDDAWFLVGDEVELAVNFLEANPKVAVVAYDILVSRQPEVQPRSAPLQVGVFAGCGHVIRIKACQQVGFYENTPGGYGGEEKDLCLRLMDAGYSIVRLPGVHVWHDKTPMAREIEFQHQSGVCNDLAIALRRSPATHLPLLLAIRISRRLMFSWKSRQMKSCFRGLALFVKSFGSIWSSRQPVKAETMRSYSKLTRKPISHS